MIQPAFHRKAIGALADMISLTNRQLLAEWEWAAEEKRSVNVTRDVSRMVLEVVLRSIFGDDYASVAAPFSILSDQPERSLEFADAFRPLARIVIEKAASRREANHIAGDILGMMMEARDRASNRPMSDAQLAREIMTLVVAGHETTASVLNWTWYLLSQHPLVEAKLSDELRRRGANEVLRLDELPRSSYARQVIEEAMRLYPPGWLMTRKAIKEDQIGEYFVPAGTEIYISPYLIQRHPDLWEEPGRFNPDRFAPGNSMRRHALAALPFSAGPRNCVGEFLARIEMQIHLMTVVPRMRLCYSSTGPPDLVAGVNLLSRHDFIMTPEIKTRRP
jgi:cytochrome P450